MILPSWSNLENLIPREMEGQIGNISRFGKAISNVIIASFDIDDSGKYTQKLIMASAELETMILNLAGLLSNVDELCKTDIDRMLLAYLKDDLGRFVSHIDDRQNQLLEIPDGEPSSGNRVTAFRKVLKVALDLIYYSLWESSLEYDKLKEKEIRFFLRIIFHTLSMKLSVSGGIARKSTSFLKKTQLPSSWKGLFTKQGAESLAEGLGEEYGKKPEVTKDDYFESLQDNLDEPEEDSDSDEMGDLEENEND